MRLLPRYRQRRDDADGPAAKTLVVARLGQRTIEPRRLDLERVGLGAPVERRVDAGGDARAQRDVDAVRRVDDER